MRLTNLRCDGCLREPRFWEWVRGELSQTGYQDWRHPGIVFKQIGCPLTYENRRKGERVFLQIFGRPIPEELSYLCPECQQRVELEGPGLAATDSGDPEPVSLQDQQDRHFFGR
jgi:hypothetical protein